MAVRIDQPSAPPVRAPQTRPAPDAPATAAASQPSAPADRFQARAAPRPSLDGAASSAPQPPLQQKSLGFDVVPEARETSATEQSVSKSATPAAPIKDFQTTTSTIHFDEDVDLKSLKANLDVNHTWRGDLVVKLTSPSGTTATLANREGGSSDDIKGSFDLSETFKGESTKGDWTLTVEDRAGRDEGTLNTWSLDATGDVKEPPQPAVVPVAISDVEARYGWAQGSWQDRLLQAADHKAGSPDGKVTVKELDDYLAAPDDLQFITSSAMQQERAQVAGGAKTVNDFDDGWQRNMARAADSNHDGSLTSSELNGYLTSVKSAGSGASTQWMPDQKAAPFDSRIADFTKEADFLTPAGGLPNSTLLSKNYMRISEDSQKRVPQWVSYSLTAADIAERPAGVQRKDNFKPDPELRDGSQLADYKGSGFDRGHQRPAADSVNQESMDESFLLSNMAPQKGPLNQRSWALLEQATNELVEATGAKATIITGGLFLDKSGNPLPPEQTQWIGAGGQKRVGVPTDFFKAVLLQFPDGTAKTFAYVCPNTDNVGSKQPEQAAFLRNSRVSVDQLEQKLGEDLFAGLDPAVQAQIEADPMPSFAIPNAQNFKFASVVWPQS
ncbi:MAG TPA: DNA/RNA non-specific endonuclease [Myxococcales bacterium]|nr:DNA/RNA non-specific endonuclease [Myxococcales bacterium]